MYNYEMSIVEASELVTKSNFDYRLIIDPPKVFQNLKLTLERAYRSEDKGYLSDVEVGLALYEYFLKDENFSVRVASNENFWIFLQVRVVPNLVISRWGQSTDHFYSRANRIWLYTLWWYVHLCWQGDFDATRKVIKDLNTDVIMNLVERTGGGYNVELSRAIMKRFAQQPNRSIFRKLMILNRMYTLNIIPEMYNGGIDGYVDFLFEEVMK